MAFEVGVDVGTGALAWIWNYFRGVLGNLSGEYTVFLFVAGEEMEGSLFGNDCANLLVFEYSVKFREGLLSIGEVLRLRMVTHLRTSPLRWVCR